MTYKASHVSQQESHCKGDSLPRLAELNLPLGSQPQRPSTSLSLVRWATAMIEASYKTCAYFMMHRFSDGYLQWCLSSGLRLFCFLVYQGIPAPWTVTIGHEVWKNLHTSIVDTVEVFKSQIASLGCRSDKSRKE